MPPSLSSQAILARSFGVGKGWPDSINFGVFFVTMAGAFVSLSAAGSMIIDWHTHVHSLKEQAAPFWGGRCPATIDNVLRLHDEVGLDLSVISNSGHYLKSYTRAEAVPV